MRQLILLFLILLGFGTRLLAQIQDKDSTEIQKLYWEAAGEYTWEGVVMASEYDSYDASAQLVLDSNGYFTWYDDFPMGPEAHEFSLIAELMYKNSDSFMPEERFLGESIESCGRYSITNDSIIHLFFFTVTESYTNEKKIKSQDDLVNITIHVYGQSDSLQTLQHQTITIQYAYNNLPYNNNFDPRYPDTNRSLTSESGTVSIKIPKGKHAGNLYISCNNYYSEFVDDFDTEKGYDYELNVYLSNPSAKNHHRHVHESHGASVIKTGVNELTLTTVESGETVRLTKIK